MSKQIEEVMALVKAHQDAWTEFLSCEEDEAPFVKLNSGAALTAIESKLRELLPVWQPIESCLDDDWVIVWLPADEAQVIAQRSEGNWFGDDGLLHEDPTLWMPLQNDPAT